MIGSFLLSASFSVPSFGIAFFSFLGFLSFFFFFPFLPSAPSASSSSKIPWLSDASVTFFFFFPFLSFFFFSGSCSSCLSSSSSSSNSALPSFFQKLSFFSFLPAASVTCSPTAVSYTHLDVYKRQVHTVIIPDFPYSFHCFKNLLNTVEK